MPSFDALNSSAVVTVKITFEVVKTLAAVEKTLAAVN